MRTRLLCTTLLGMAAMALAVGLTACPTPPIPKGPAPEYEDPPAPSWLEAGSPTASDSGAPTR